MRGAKRAQGLLGERHKAENSQRRDPKDLPSPPKTPLTPSLDEIVGTPLNTAPRLPVLSGLTAEGAGTRPKKYCTISLQSECFTEAKTTTNCPEARLLKSKTLGSFLISEKDQNQKLDLFHSKMVVPKQSFSQDHSMGFESVPARNKTLKNSSETALLSPSQLQPRVSNGLRRALEPTGAQQAPL